MLYLIKSDLGILKMNYKSEYKRTNELVKGMPWAWTSEYSGDLNNKLVRYANGPKQFARWIVCYSSHGLNSELRVRQYKCVNLGIRANSSQAGNRASCGHDLGLSLSSFNLT